MKLEREWEVGFMFVKGFVGYSKDFNFYFEMGIFEGF